MNEKTKNVSPLIRTDLAYDDYEFYQNQGISDFEKIQALSSAARYAILTLYSCLKGAFVHGRRYRDYFNQGRRKKPAGLPEFHPEFRAARRRD